MKKVMIALVTVGIAVMANAASSVTWNVFNYDEVTGPISGYFTGTMYINCAEADIVNQAIIVNNGSFDAYFDAGGEPSTEYSMFFLTGSMVVGDTTWTYTATSTDAMVDGSGTGTAGFFLGTWSPTTPIPEPTSAVLMLVGMAGLALRRRRA